MNLQNIFDTLKEMTIQAGSTLKSLYQSAAPYVKSGVKATGTVLKKGYKAASALCTKLRTYAQQAAPYIKEGLQTAETAIKDGLTVVGDALGELKDYVQSGQFKEDTSALINHASESLDKLLGNLEDKVKTNKTARAFAIKKVSSSIDKLEPSNTNKIDKLGKIINSFELCNPKYGEIVDKGDVEKFANILKQNPEYSEEYKMFNEMLTNYPTKQTPQNNNHSVAIEKPSAKPVAHSPVAEAGPALE